MSVRILSQPLSNPTNTGKYWVAKKTATHTTYILKPMRGTQKRAYTALFYLKPEIKYYSLSTSLILNLTLP